MQENTYIGKNIAMYRQQAGMTQEQLAAMLGVSRATVIAWETGRYAPPKGKWADIADALEITPDALTVRIVDTGVYETLTEDLAQIQDRLLALETPVRVWYSPVDPPRLVSGPVRVHIARCLSALSSIALYTATEEEKNGTSNDT